MKTATRPSFLQSGPDTLTLSPAESEETLEFLERGILQNSNPDRSLHGFFTTDVNTATLMHLSVGLLRYYEQEAYNLEIIEEMGGNMAQGGVAVTSGSGDGLSEVFYPSTVYDSVISSDPCVDVKGLRSLLSSYPIGLKIDPVFNLKRDMISRGRITITTDTHQSLLRELTKSKIQTNRLFVMRADPNSFLDSSVSIDSQTDPLSIASMQISMIRNLLTFFEQMSKDGVATVTVGTGNSMAELAHRLFLINALELLSKQFSLNYVRHKAPLLPLPGQSISAMGDKRYRDVLTLVSIAGISIQGPSEMFKRFKLLSTCSQSTITSLLRDASKMAWDSLDIYSIPQNEEGIIFIGDILKKSRLFN